ncbi:hypothetical protein BDF20DRAFT_876208 [Mycotypha africana]|uniref:uncharacterized protein n=1 Tax=Mycotypha africana TaxID=64632 RepID=UPI0023001D5C|nr:uncharacterized protein BDF20DRAFT_876208 [Mycotypha africana]KAI8977664.1 hypothetical protein BDF20DRAFT_876208 [Mycotypha africana]
MVDAICLDVSESYDFILGRLAMQKIGVGVDLKSSYWYIRTSGNLQRIPVSYFDPLQEAYSTESSLMAISSADIEDSSNEVESQDGLSTLISQINDNRGLSQSEKEQAIALILEKRAAFGTTYQDIKQTNLLKLRIDTGDATTIMKRPFSSMSPSDLERLKSELREMLETGVNHSSHAHKGRIK